MSENKFIHDHSSLQVFDEGKGLFEQDFRKEVCEHKKYVPFPCIKIDTMPQLRGFFERVYEEEWEEGEEDGCYFIFRGQADSDWLLESTLERMLTERMLAKRMEEKIFDRFKNRLRGKLVDQSLLNNVSSSEGKREIWAIGRHYGLKTPFIDWTESVYVAAFMALSESLESHSGYSALFVVDRKYFPNWYGVVPMCWFTPVTDYYGRVSAQKGFLSHYNIKEDIDNALKKWGQRVAMKIYINNCLKGQALGYFRHIGVEYLTMYPDMQGAVMDVNNWLEREVASRGEDNG